MRETAGVGKDAVAGAERTLGRFDEAVNVIEAFRFGHAKARKQGEDHQRGDALGRRVGVVDRACREIEPQRLAERRFIVGEIRARDGTADLIEIGCDLAADIAAVEVIKAFQGEVPQRCRQRLLRHCAAFGRRLAVAQKCIGETGRDGEFEQLVGGQPRLAARHHVAVAGLHDGGKEQDIRRQRAAVCLRRV